MFDPVRDGPGRAAVADRLTRCEQAVLPLLYSRD